MERTLVRAATRVGMVGKRSPKSRLSGKLEKSNGRGTRQDGSWCHEEEQGEVSGEIEMGGARSAREESYRLGGELTARVKCGRRARIKKLRAVEKGEMEDPS